MTHDTGDAEQGRGQQLFTPDGSEPAGEVQDVVRPSGGSAQMPVIGAEVAPRQAPESPAPAQGGAASHGTAIAKKGASSFLRVFGDVKRVGVFRMEERTSGTLVFGDALYDLREAEIPADAELTIYSLFGDVKVIVPPGMRVSTSGALVFGEDKIDTAHTDGGPTLKIHHVSLFGDTKVKTALPGEKIPKRWRWF